MLTSSLQLNMAANMRHALKRLLGLRGRSASAETGRMIVLILACAAGLAVLGAMQFSWMGQAREFQRVVALDALDASMNAFESDLQRDAAQLLTLFKEDLVLDRADRLESYLGRYEFWWDATLYGPSLKRVLFFDRAEGVGAEDELSELAVGSGSIRRIEWPEDLAALGSELSRTGFRPRRPISPRWLATWMVYPEYAAVVRPMMMPLTAAAPKHTQPRLQGYLILQLDLVYVTEQMLPALVGQHIAGPNGQRLYDVALILNGECVQLYRPKADVEASLWPADSVESGYFLAGTKAASEVAWLQQADWKKKLLLKGGAVPPLANRRGATQRLTLWPFSTRTNIAGSRQVLAAPPDGSEELGSSALVPARPRVFLSASREYALELAANHIGGSLSQVLTQQYRWNVRMGMGILVLLAAAIVLVAKGARRAARLAEMRMEFVTSVSHELRTPVSVMRAIGDNIASGLLGSDKRAIQYGEVIRDQGRRLSEMIESTLQQAKIESGAVPLSVQAIDVSKITDDVLADARPHIERAGITVERAEAQGLPPVRADETALRQSLANLLTNAIKYGAAGRWVKLETVEEHRGKQREVQIRVHDRGPGMQPSEAGQVFDPYFRTVGAIKSAVPGSGLGLKLARDLIRGMGGSLTLESEPGQGSVFTIHLPIEG